MIPKKQQLMQKGLSVCFCSFCCSFFYAILYFPSVFFFSDNKHSLFQLAEALYKHGKGDNKEALELLGHDFEAVNYKVYSKNS